MIIAVPIDTPVRLPDKEPMVATDVGALIHVPPGAPSDSVIVAPTQTAVAPVMGRGNGLITITALPVMVRVHPAHGEPVEPVAITV